VLPSTARQVAGAGVALLVAPSAAAAAAAVHYTMVDQAVLVELADLLAQVLGIMPVLPVAVVRADVAVVTPMSKWVVEVVHQQVVQALLVHLIIPMAVLVLQQPVVRFRLAGVAAVLVGMQQAVLVVQRRGASTMLRQALFLWWEHPLSPITSVQAAAAAAVVVLASLLPPTSTAALAGVVSGVSGTQAP
jgi:hypothetical protein